MLKLLEELDFANGGHIEAVYDIQILSASLRQPGDGSLPVNCPTLSFLMAIFRPVAN